MKTLVLCRHAKSDWPLHVDDLDRPLKKRGENDALRLGELLASHSFSPDLILSSPANRALSTATLIAEALAYETEDILTDPSIYYEGVGNLMAVIEKLPPEADTVMIFGHNPTMEQAVRFLLQADTPFQMPTSGMACFEAYAVDWKRFQDASPMLRWLQVPRLRRKD
jgi:phosphohistidine phosphatase